MVGLEAAANAKDAHRRNAPEESAPQGVRGRNSDNTKLRAVLGWEPTITVEEGMAELVRNSTPA